MLLFDSNLGGVASDHAVGEFLLHAAEFSAFGAQGSEGGFGRGMDHRPVFGPADQVAQLAKIEAGRSPTVITDSPEDHADVFAGVLL